MSIEPRFNDPGTTLASNATSGATTISVISSSGYPSGATEFRILVDSELMLVTNITGTTWTVTRGIEGTTAASHTSGAAVNSVVTAAGFDKMLRQANLNIHDYGDRVRAGGTLAMAKGKGVTVANGATQTLLSYSGGPGYVADIFFTHDSNNSINMTVTVDGSTVYSGPHCYFILGARYAAITSPFANQITSSLGGLVSKIPIPFTSSISITITNNSGTTATTYWEIGYVKLPEVVDWGRCNKLNVAQAGLSSSGDTALSLSQDQTGTLLNLSSSPPGQLLGICLEFNGASVNNNSILEGPVKFTIDGTLEFVTSGAEDYFEMADYFAAVSAGVSSAWASLIYKDPGSGHFFAACRFHVPDPVLFENALKVEVQMGDSTSGLTFTGSCLLGYTVWYYTAS